MRHLATGIDVGAPAERLWELIAVFDNWPEWGSSIRAVDSPSVRVEPGGEGRVRTVAGFWLQFRICEVVPGRFWIWDVAGIGATGHHVMPLGDKACRVEFTAPWIAAPYLLVLRRSLRRLKRLAEGS